LVYVHRADGSVVVRRGAETHADFTARQLGCQSRFRQAQQWAKALRADPERYAPYKTAARIRHKRACDIAISDFLKPPVVQDIDLSGYTGKAGEPIRIEAIDEVAVSSVSVTVAHLDGVLIETGAALSDESGTRWTYLSQVSGPASETVIVHATAVDRPGNAVTKTVHHALVGGA